MSKRSVALAANLRGMPDAFPNSSAGWSTRGYISASSRVKVPGGATTTYWANGTQSSSPAGMINAVAAISNTALKNTQIDFAWIVRLGNSGGTVYEYNMCVFIDWDNSLVSWSGRATDHLYGRNVGLGGYAIANGKTSINPLGGSVSLKKKVGANLPTMVLVTGPNKNILGLPAPLSNQVRENAIPEAMGNYTITTDDGINVTATPAPADPETPEVAPVVGVKISELNAVDALQDDDLFVLSQDNAADGTYDASYNVTLNNLKANIDGAAGWSSGWSAAAGNNTSTPYSHTLNSTDVVWQIYVAENDEGLNAIALDVQLDLQASQNDTLGALLSDVTTTSFNLQLGGGYLATLKFPQTTISFSTPVKFVKVVGRRS
jgi:hypothetical protein